MNKRHIYGILSIMLFSFEILIGLFASGWIRNYLGDVLVVILLYTLIRTVRQKKNETWYAIPTSILVLAFAVEFLQLWGFCDRLGITNKLLRIIIGTGFAVEDLVAYIIGIVPCYLVEYCIELKENQRSGLFDKDIQGNSDIENICKKIDDYFRAVDRKLLSYDTYIENSYSGEVVDECNILKKELKETTSKLQVIRMNLRKRGDDLTVLSESIDRRIIEHNNAVALKRVDGIRKIIGNIEGRPLDTQQIICIAKPLKTHLVIAGAGSGKTTSIVGKVKYLIKTGEYKPEDILVLSFTNASAAEMKIRINKETGCNIEASTFHKFGLNIIKSVNGIAPKITSIQLQKFAKEKLTEFMKDTVYLNLICCYLLNSYKHAVSEFDFQSEKDYSDYIKMNPPLTLNGESVKSYGEMEIANFLYQNGIVYEYEKEYEVDTRTEDRFQYYPDFYLPEYGIYIEFFGINEDGEVPVYFGSRDGKNPSEEYRAGMEWKRNLHKTNNTTLIECYSYERSKGELLTLLEEKLKKAGVEFNPISTEMLWDKISEKQTSNVLSGLADLIATIISLIKSNDYSLQYVKEIYREKAGSLYNSYILDILDILEPIYEGYVSALRENDEIDFNDMINDAAKMISSGKYNSTFKYVIVDEYQDISKSRYNLLKALRDKTDYKLFCVGDDWQSIYRFTGSDTDYTINFRKYWGPYEISKIETTYRFSESMSSISSTFIMRNPEQIRKYIQSASDYKGFALGEIKGYTEEWAVKFMIDKIKELPKDSSVFFIGRYTFDSRLLSDNKDFDCRYDNASGIAYVVYPERKDLKMQFLTAHKSKGLQADYVFIINNKDRGMGFPSKIQDTPLVNALLEGSESYPFAEERRLFYVAMTRAKIKAFLVTVDGNESVFVKELESQYEKELKTEKYACPRCGGRLVKRSSAYGEFYGCSNYRSLGCTYKKKIGGRQV